MKNAMVLLMLSLLGSFSFADSSVEVLARKKSFDISQLVGSYVRTECSGTDAADDRTYKTIIVTQPSATSLHMEMTWGDLNYEARGDVQQINAGKRKRSHAEDALHTYTTNESYTIENGVEEVSNSSEFFTALHVPVGHYYSRHTLKLENDVLVRETVSRFIGVKTLGHTTCRYNRVKP